MYTLGVPHTQIVDDWLPMNGSNTIFAGLGKDGSAWGAILEKAFAKRYGNWEHTVGGWMYAAVAALNGSPWRNTSHSSQNDDTIWDLIKSHDIDKDVMTAATYFCGSDSDQNDDGLACSHAYTVIGHYETSRGDKLIKVRNPWGSEQYHGPWSRQDEIWNNEELKKEIEDAMGDANTSNEGIFYMDIKSYRENFQLSCINEDTSSWFFDYFLMLEDPSTSGNTLHTLKLKNTADVTQKVHVGGNVWQDRTYGWYNSDCYGATNASHFLKIPGTNIAFSSFTGAGWASIELTPG